MDRLTIDDCAEKHRKMFEQNVELHGVLEAVERMIRQAACWEVSVHVMEQKMRTLRAKKGKSNEQSA